MFKIVSIGEYFPGVETFSFDSIISLTDFDIVIVDPGHVSLSFPQSELGSDNRRYINGRNAHVANELIDRRRNEFYSLVNNGKMIVSFLDPLYETVIGSQHLDKHTIDNYSWIPSKNLKTFTHQMINGIGSGVQLFDKQHLFAPYYLAFQKDLIFGAYIDTNPNDFKYGEVFILNSANRIIGFSAKISNGIAVFLPKFNSTEENGKKFMGVLLQIAKKYFGSEAKSPPPDWTSTFVVPGVDLLDKKINDIEKKILEFESQKSEIEKERSNLNDYKSLLYEQGHVLEKKVIDALRLMGFKAETVLGENTDFDVILESEEGRAIAEVEGKDDSAIHKDKIDQLLSAINQDGENRDSFAKGVLVGNHYRNKILDEREEPFTKTVVSLAKQYHYALITTVDLYKATIYFLQHPEDEDCKKACRKVIFEADGSVVEFPILEENSKE